jgi:hypothetical protein
MSPYQHGTVIFVPIVVDPEPLKTTVNPLKNRNP